MSVGKTLDAVYSALTYYRIPSPSAKFTHWPANVPVGTERVLSVGNGELADLMSDSCDAIEAVENYAEMLLDWDVVQERIPEAFRIRRMLEVNKTVTVKAVGAALSMIDQLDNHINKQAEHIALNDYSTVWKPAIRIGGAGFAEKEISTLPDIKALGIVIIELANGLQKSIKDNSSTPSSVHALIDEMAEEADC